MDLSKTNSLNCDDLSDETIDLIVKTMKEMNEYKQELENKNKNLSILNNQNQSNYTNTTNNFANSKISTSTSQNSSSKRDDSLTFKQKNKELAKKRKKAKRHEMFKSIVKFAIKSGLAVGGVGLAFETVIVGANYYDAVCNEKLDFEEIEYHKNPKIEAGYYNEHPVTINISNNIDKKYKETFENAIKTFDKKAEGITFEISYGDPEKNDADIDIEYRKVNNSWLAYAKIGKLDSDKISGFICVDTDKTPSFLLGAVVQHELGHVIGLQHSKNPHDLMFPNVGRFSLSKNDIDKINTIYPKASDVKPSVDVAYTIVPTQYLSSSFTTTNEREEDQMQM